MLNAIIDFILNLFRKEPDLKPDVDFYEIDAPTVIQELQSQGVVMLYGQLDYSYYYTTEWGWKQIVDWVRSRYNFPSWAAEKTDCDDFAFLMKGLVSSEFGVNAIGFVIGASPQGAHAFNKIRTDKGWVDLEPQNGKIVDNYTSHSALL